MVDEWRVCNEKLTKEKSLNNMDFTHSVDSLKVLKEKLNGNELQSMIDEEIFRNYIEYDSSETEVNSKSSFSEKRD